jgi:hypothetical protein
VSDAGFLLVGCLRAVGLCAARKGPAVRPLEMHRCFNNIYRHMQFTRTMADDRTIEPDVVGLIAIVWI